MNTDSAVSAAKIYHAALTALLEDVDYNPEMNTSIHLPPHDLVDRYGEGPVITMSISSLDFLGDPGTIRWEQGRLTMNLVDYGLPSDFAEQHHFEPYHEGALCFYS